MSRKTLALLGLGVILLLAIPVLGTASAGDVPRASNPGNAVSTKAPQVVPTEVNGYKMVVQAPLAIRSDFYGGATIPVKFQLWDPNGNPVTDAMATLWVNGQAATASGSANQNNTFRFDPIGMMYVYNLNTKPYPAGPGSPNSTITIKAVVGTTMLTQDFVVSFD